MALVTKDTGYPRPSEFFTPKGRLLVSKLGGAIQRLGHVCVGSDGQLYRYRDGAYRSDGDIFARVETKKFLASRWKRYHASEVLDWLRAHYATIGDQPRTDLINLRNGLLDWRTGQLQPHSPRFLSTTQLPVAFMADADCPRIMQFLREVLPEDAIDLIFEVFGLALYAGNPLRVAILFLGPGRNGKSRLLDLIVLLLGEDNVSAVPLQMLAENRFRAAELYRMLANVCGDLDSRAVKQSDIFKMLTGGDPVQAERKYRDPFTFRPFALPIFSANEPPMSQDQTDAWFDRWVVVPMNRRIPEERQDPHLIHKLGTESELQGLLVRSLEGLRRLLERGRFDFPPSVREAQAKYRLDLDTVAGFVDEKCTVGPAESVPRSTVYDTYRRWCQNGGRPPVSAREFNSRLRERYAGKVIEKASGGIRRWDGIGLASNV